MSVMAEGHFMSGGYGRNRTARQIMELLWNAEIPLSYEEIAESVKGMRRTRKINICLTELEEAGMIGIKGDMGYFAVCKKDEFIDRWGKEQIKNFLKAPQFPAGNLRKIKRLSEEDAAELRKLL
jgi:predicted transcriptional regulator